MLELRNLSKIYQTKTRRVAALDGVSFTLPEKGFVFILGRSGSGKTTMLNMLGGLDAPTEGELIVDGVSSRDFRQADFDNYRNRYVGFVFQEYHLLDDYTVADNIALALELQGDLTQEERQQKILPLWNRWIWQAMETATQGSFPEDRSSEWLSPGPW